MEAPDVPDDNPLQNCFSSPFSVLVTGGTGAIGAAVTAVLCARGLHVVANYANDETRARDVQSDTGCELQRADIANESAVEKLFATHSFRAVVHAAGISHDALLLRQSEASWSQTLRVNADGAFLVMRASLRYLPDGGRVVLLGSRVGEDGAAGQGAYAAAKAVGMSLSQSAALEGGKRRIAVNCVCPGWVPSRLTGQREPKLEQARRRSCFGTLGRADETAAIVSWLLSAHADGVSAQIFHADSRLRFAAVAT